MQRALGLVERLKRARGAADVDEELARKLQKFEEENRALRRELERAGSGSNGESAKPVADIEFYEKSIKRLETENLDLINDLNKLRHRSGSRTGEAVLRQMLKSNETKIRSLERENGVLRAKKSQFKLKSEDKTVAIAKLLEILKKKGSISAEVKGILNPLEEEFFLDSTLGEFNSAELSDLAFKIDSKELAAGDDLKSDASSKGEQRPDETQGGRRREMTHLKIEIEKKIDDKIRQRSVKNLRKPPSREKRCRRCPSASQRGSICRKSRR